MGSHGWSKLIGVSLALAVAGILTCVGAILDVYIPGRSQLGSLGRVALIAFAVTATVIGYTWVCDKSENYLNGRLQRLLSTRKLNRRDAEQRAAVGPAPTEPKAVGSALPIAHAPPLSGDRQIRPYRGATVSRVPATGTRSRPWRGQ